MLKPGDIIMPRGAFARDGYYLWKIFDRRSSSGLWHYGLSTVVYTEQGCVCVVLCGAGTHGGALWMLSNSEEYKVSVLT